NLKVAQVEAGYDAAKRRVLAASRLEELTHVRLVELAHAEFSNIVADAESGDQEIELQQSERQRVRNVCTCPKCGRRLQFPRKAAGMTIKCPYSSCGSPMRLPPLQPS